MKLDISVSHCINLDQSVSDWIILHVVYPGPSYKFGQYKMRTSTYKGISSVESQKGINNVQRSVENQKGDIAVQSLWL